MPRDTPAVAGPGAPGTASHERIRGGSLETPVKRTKGTRVSGGTGTRGTRHLTMLCKCSRESPIQRRRRLTRKPRATPWETCSPKRRQPCKGETTEVSPLQGYHGERGPPSPRALPWADMLHAFGVAKAPNSTCTTLLSIGGVVHESGSHAAARLLASKQFTRRVVLEKWFLHMHDPPLAAGQRDSAALLDKPAVAPVR